MWFPALTMFSVHFFVSVPSHPPVCVDSVLSFYLSRSQIFNNLLFKVYKQPSEIVYNHCDLYLTDAPFFKIIKAIFFIPLLLLCSVFFCHTDKNKNEIMPIILAYELRQFAYSIIITHTHRQSHEWLRRWFLHGRYK